MYQEERIQKILEYLEIKKTLSNQEVVKSLGVSRDTARRDIIKIVEQGMAVRTHGGITTVNSIAPYNTRSKENINGKKILAEQVIQYLSCHKVCFFDASTTIEQLCKITPKTLMVYTHSIDNMSALSRQGVDVHIFGGKLNHKNRFVYGGETLHQIETMYFDMAFLGAAGISEDGFYVEDQEDASIKRKIIERSESVCVVVDAKKFAIKSRYKFADFKDINIITTNKQPKESIQQKIKVSGTVLDIVKGSV